MTRRTLAPIVALALSVAACGSSGDADETAADAATTAPEVTETAATEARASTTTAPDTLLPGTTAPSTNAVPATTSPATTAPSATSAPTADAAEPFTPVDDGPYDVGVQTITLDDDPSRPLTVDVWFPLDASIETATLTPAQYTMLPGVYYESPLAFAATPDATSADGPFPLVVYSHGSGGLRYIHSAYTEALASHGYVVAAPDHTGNTAVERITGGGDDPAVISLDRPNDVRRVIDAMTDPADVTAGSAAANVDPEQIVVTGHSFGGFTTIAMAIGYTNDLGDFAADDRVDAIVPLAPAVSSNSFSDDALATIDVPMMVVVGTDDVTTPVDPNVTRLWDNATLSSPSYRVELVAGEHQSFTDLCAYLDDVPSLPDIPPVVVETIEVMSVEGCSEGDMTPARVAELLDTYVLAFLDEVLAGGPTVLEATGTPPDDVNVVVR
ncbi:MAG: dienelactone hydrolase family protein [Ilumatobacter sp.]|nr:dienelactone hydrolase family protein [Ilumatobacter sp.]